ncbi:MAG: DUF5343 domain-containing protein [Thiomicrorhabdus chilensis]|uniref:DUF5343 domain-containing protein n=1 Tax=Thiomicrorhabdus chilensis TaxID=63656 RepID=UPI00299D1F20|nr:DUF5343 domain-containing protein [Thiomicrorhabdus chilensis]MDX1347504.1 DUF5343 domain-containing protein [Thiomicrorhabdus chilensis]
MANGDTSFPKIADANWWKLRDLFKRKVPAIVTPTYLATALSMGEASARSNLIGPFKKIGIIDSDGKPTDRAYDWRDDHKYKAVCEALIEEYYPQEIKDLFHSPDADLQQLTNWFMSHARCGEPAAKMYARFYILLLKADPSEAEAATAKKETVKKASAKPKKKKEKAAKKPEPVVSESDANVQPPVAPIPAQPVQTVLSNAPELHINIQLHISPESSAEQIDRIFESMAKHLKDFNK